MNVDPALEELAARTLQQAIDRWNAHRWTGMAAPELLREAVSTRARYLAGRTGPAELRRIHAAIQLDVLDRLVYAGRDPDASFAAMDVALAAQVMVALDPDGRPLSSRNVAVGVTRLCRSERNDA